MLICFEFVKKFWCIQQTSHNPFSYPSATKVKFTQICYFNLCPSAEEKWQISSISMKPVNQTFIINTCISVIFFFDGWNLQLFFYFSEGTLPGYLDMSAIFATAQRSIRFNTNYVDGQWIFRQTTNSTVKLNILTPFQHNFNTPLRPLIIKFFDIQQNLL